MSKMNPLHTPKFIYDYMLANCEYMDTRRHTGRSTALAFSYIAAAMRKPNQWVKVEDHDNDHTNNNLLRHKCMHIVERQGLEHFTYKDNLICFGKTDAYGPASTEKTHGG